MRKRIYLDCDGVLADFDRGAAAILGLAPDAFQKAHGSGEFWKRLAHAPEFFANLDPLPDAMDLYEAVRHRRPVILTGLPRGNWAAAQKRRWAERHFPGVPIITTMAALKREHCLPGDALVDDRDKHRHLWEAEGGVFIHHKSAATSIASLREKGFI
ncbi:MAG TPA: hypothetical protein VIP08_13195 [Phenylobacterium sp.]|uniref:5' nucleotidase, NT5C type n=1 Tax=Phenylobacterium sp. TaxID=1871053 RepID=UPI002F9257DC